jgi:hypothetical protein
VEYPAVYKYGSDGVLGLACTEEIAPYETIAYIPTRLMISTELARNSEIAEIYRQFEDLFVANADRDFLTLVLYLIYERSKGKDSFWHP